MEFKFDIEKDKEFIKSMKAIGLKGGRIPLEKIDEAKDIINDVKHNYTRDVIEYIRSQLKGNGNTLGRLEELIGMDDQYEQFTVTTPEKRVFYIAVSANGNGCTISSGKLKRKVNTIEAIKKILTKVD